MSITIKDCFDNNGALKFDPYRFDRENETPTRVDMFDALFTEGGWLMDGRALKELIDKNPHWPWTCNAVGLHHAQILASATKGSYPTYYYFR